MTDNEDADNRDKDLRDSQREPAPRRKGIREIVQEIRARDAEEVIDENGNDIRIVSVRA